MSAAEAIREAEALLPGVPAPEGQIDPRWRAIIAIGDFLATEPDAVWQFIRIWGDHTQEDLRMAIATCLLEHLLEQHFEAFFPRVKELALTNSRFGDTLLMCWKFGQAEQPANVTELDSLKTKLMRRNQA
jgi:hypothetical protein